MTHIVEKTSQPISINSNPVAVERTRVVFGAPIPSILDKNGAFVAAGVKIYGDETQLAAELKRAFLVYIDNNEDHDDPHISVRRYAGIFEVIIDEGEFTSFYTDFMSGEDAEVALGAMKIGFFEQVAAEIERAWDPAWDDDAD